MFTFTWANRPSVDGSINLVGQARPRVTLLSPAATTTTLIPLPLHFQRRIYTEMSGSLGPPAWCFDPPRVGILCPTSGLDIASNFPQVLGRHAPECQATRHTQERAGSQNCHYALTEFFTFFCRAKSVRQRIVGVTGGECDI